VVRDALRDSGFDLEGLEQVRAGRRSLLRVIIDSDAGVALDDVAAVSRVVSLALDERDDLLGGPYTLEVTSPGVDRPLTHPRHWRRNRLRLVRATVADEGELVGRVGDCDDEGVTLLVSGALRRVRYASLVRAVVEVEFHQPPAAELALLGGARQQADSAEDLAGQDLEER
jgi:ribosome maturation factor RimP